MSKKTQKPTTVATSAALLSTIDAIAATQKKWSKEYDSVQKKLYAILADCYKVTDEIRNAPAKVVKEFNSALSDRGYKRLSATRTETKVIRVVFGEIGTNRAAGYATVLAEAKKHGVKHTRLAKWIAEHGGIEEIRRNGVGGKSSEQKRDDVVLNTIKVLDAKPDFDLKTLTKHEGLEYSVVVMRTSSDGTAVPVAEVASLSTVKNVLVSLKLDQVAKSDDDNQDKSDKRKKQALVLADVIKIAKESGLDVSALLEAA